VIVAMTGWIGFVWRKTPLALTDTCCGRIWRAASTITYANAAAAFLTACLLVSLALLATAQRPWRLCLVAFGLAVGLLATLSRGSWIGLVAGLATLAALDGVRVFSRAVPVFVGAAVATSALLPSLHVSQSRHVALGCLGLLAGAALSVMPLRRSALVVCALALAAVVIPGSRHELLDGWRTVDQGRFTASSPDRTRALDAAFRIVREHPIVGVGPGLVDLTWDSTGLADPVEMHLEYVHNEYVQVLAETGAIGFVILVCGLAATGATAFRSRRNGDAVAASGCLAALVALGVHSTTDFLWHVPIISLTGALLVATVLPRPRTGALPIGSSVQ
jgi:O-antigen ligase